MNIKQEPNNCELTSQDTSETYKRNHSEDKQSQVLQSTCNDKDGKSQGKSVKLEINTEFKQEFKQEPFEDTNENFDPPSVNENIEIDTTDTIQPSQVLQSESNDKDGKNQGKSAQNFV